MTVAAHVDAALTVQLRHKLGRIALDVQLDARRETLALIGPSGSGKTSVLLSIAGLLSPDWGRISVAGCALVDTERSIRLRPEERRVGMVFQDGALFPNMSVARNVGYGLYPRPSSRPERKARVAETLDRFRISRLASSKPTAISGGERQRVALARAVATTPQVLLLDEPLSALDSVTKAHIAAELAQWLADLRLPTILVSHDFSDVVGLADRVAVIEEGRIVQSGTTTEVLRAPESAFVAAFAGINFFCGVASRHAGLTEVKVNDDVQMASTDTVTGAVGAIVRPWDVTLSTEKLESSALNTLHGPIIQVTEVGSVVRVTVGSTPAIVAEVTSESAGRLGLVVGRPIIATWKAAATRLVPKGTDSAAPPV
jgi:molybdenum ABC transporter ATP-binding protein